jgi:hypothetical protein
MLDRSHLYRLKAALDRVEQSLDSFDGDISNEKALRADDRSTVLADALNDVHAAHKPASDADDPRTWGTSSVTGGCADVEGSVSYALQLFQGGGGATPQFALSLLSQCWGRLDKWRAFRAHVRGFAERLICTASANLPQHSTVLSRQDLPHIIKAVQQLYRVVESPPEKDWQAPPWLIDRYKRFTCGGEALSSKEAPSQVWLISQASGEVLDRLTPPIHHHRPDCPEITESQLDQRHKATLIELRSILGRFPLSLQTDAAGNVNRAAAIGCIDYLESVLLKLGSCPQAADEPAGKAVAARKRSAPASATKGKHIDERMLAAIRDDPERIYWSSPAWADYLDCGKTTVIESRTWRETCAPARARERLARGKRLRKKKPT